MRSGTRFGKKFKFGEIVNLLWQIYMHLVQIFIVVKALSDKSRKTH